MAKLSYGTFRPMTKAEMTAKGLKGRQYINDSGTIIPISKFQKLAHAHMGIPQAPSRAAKPPRIKQLSPLKVGSNRLANYNRNVQRFADRYGLTPKEAKSSGRFQALNEDIRNNLKKLGGYEQTLKKLEAQGKDTTKQQEKIAAIRAILGQQFRDSGRKDPTDFSILGATPSAT